MQVPTFGLGCYVDLYNAAVASDLGALATSSAFGRRSRAPRSSRVHIQIQSEEKNNGAELEFQLTRVDRFEHHECRCRLARGGPDQSKRVTRIKPEAGLAPQKLNWRAG